MVYCRLISANENVLKYAAGGLANDLTGELQVNKGDVSYQVTKAPERSILYPRHIEAMLSKYGEKIKRGSLIEIMAYEIG